jgi:outer membrane protein OmpA-like peptidoglycan-associated protein
MRWLIPIILLIAWLFLANFWLDNKKAECCHSNVEAVSGSATSSIPSVKPANETGPILFAWSDCKPQAQADWERFRDSIVSGLPKDYLLDVKVWNYEAEENICDSKKLAESRIEQLQAMFTAHLKPDKIRFTPSVRNDKDEAWKPYSIRAANFNYAFDGEFVKEIDDKALIYFPTNSARKISNAQIDNYLKEVAARIKKTGETIALTGHSDNTGNPEANLKLGLSRANHVKEILVKMGAPQNQITVTTKGQTDPIATNDTEAGRQKNRRTELKINK